jgi:hypothetical protein
MPAMQSKRVDLPLPDAPKIAVTPDSKEAWQSKVKPGYLFTTWKSTMGVVISF